MLKKILCTVPTCDVLRVTVKPVPCTLPPRLGKIVAETKKVDAEYSTELPDFEEQYFEKMLHFLFTEKQIIFM